MQENSIVTAPVLAYELIQNADDGGAELLSFRVLEDRLEVWNDKPFTDSGSNADNCLQDPRCDFHSFRLVGSGNKAGREPVSGTLPGREAI
jgi:hypothetical protein